MSSSDQRALPKLEKLSPCVSLYRPATTRESRSQSLAPAAPKLIIFAAWMDARDAHIAKYLVRYQEIFPSSQILVLKSKAAHFTGSDKVLFRDVQPAVSVIREAVDADAAAKSPQKPQILAHLLSNGGSAGLEALYRAWPAKAEQSAHLPPRVVVFDSCPGEFTIQRGVAAFTTGVTGLMRLVVVPMMYLVALWFWIPSRVFGRPDLIAKLYAAQLDRENGKGEVRRTYIYSESDKIIDSKVVERHAGEAERLGFHVRKEEFTGSAHVGHMRTDPERYWAIVKETWEGTS